MDIPEPAYMSTTKMLLFLKKVTDYGSIKLIVIPNLN